MFGEEHLLIPLGTTRDQGILPTLEVQGSEETHHPSQTLWGTYSPCSSLRFEDWSSKTTTTYPLLVGVNFSSPVVLISDHAKTWNTVLDE